MEIVCKKLSNSKRMNLLCKRGEFAMSLYFERRQVVVPGDLLAEGNYRNGNGTFKELGKIFASVIGLAVVKGNVIHVVPLEGVYIPKAGDEVIGKIVDVSLTTWQVDIKSPYFGVLHASNAVDLPFNPLRTNIRRYFDLGDTIFAEVISFDRTRDPVLTTKGKGLGKLRGGKLVEVFPTKIPRLIGRKGSMISMIKRETGCKVVVGQNGMIWISGRTSEDEELVVSAIRKIEREAHTSGLTDRIRELIKESGRKNDEN